MGRTWPPSEGLDGVNTSLQNQFLPHKVEVSSTVSSISRSWWCGRARLRVPRVLRWLSWWKRNHLSALSPPFLATAISGLGTPQLCTPALFSEGLLQWVPFMLGHSAPLCSFASAQKANPDAAWPHPLPCRSPLQSRSLSLHPKEQC